MYIDALCVWWTKHTKYTLPSPDVETKGSAQSLPLIWLGPIDGEGGRRKYFDSNVPLIASEICLFAVP